MIRLWRSLGYAGRLVAVGVGIGIVIVVIALGKMAVDGRNRARALDVANRTQTAHTAATRAAIDTIVAAQARDEQTQERIQDEVVRIQQLPEAERYRASIALLCGMREYRSDPRCAELR